ncbi:MAG: hypothetical protein WCP29_14855 [Acidobacteriota bacterium]
MTGSIANQPDPNIRHCYCGLWQKSPETLERQNVPPGYCGLCQVCGKPGHLRHFPGAVPFTGAWCDRHYRRTLWLNPRGAIGSLIWMGVVGAIIVGMVLLRRASIL